MNKPEYERLKMDNERLKKLLFECVDTFQVVVDGHKEIDQCDLMRKIRKELLIEE